MTNIKCIEQMLPSLYVTEADDRDYYVYASDDPLSTQPSFITMICK
jgi:hypothetical protein